MLVLARRINERIIIGDNIYISIVDIKGDQVKLGIDAPSQVKVYRQEVYDAIQEENRKAALSQGGVLPSLSTLIERRGKAEEQPKLSPREENEEKQP